MKYIRKPGKPKKGALENFKPKIFEIVPELKELTDEDLEKILEDEEE